MDENAEQFAFVVASTDRSSGRGYRIFEVHLDESDGFSRSTVVDGRWVYTTWRQKLSETGVYRFTLPERRMEQVSLAVFEGLQLDP